MAGGKGVGVRPVVYNSVQRGPTIAGQAVARVPHRTELKRLILQIERDLHVQASLRTLLAAADARVAGRRQDLRAVKARIKRGAAKAAGQ